MARSARKFSESGMYHILLRSKGRIFDTEADYIKFIAVMRECFSKYGGLLGYILLPNRVHIIFLDKSGKLSTVMRIITARYSRYKKMSVFYDRFKCEPVDGNTELAQMLAFIGSGPFLSESEFVFCSEIDSGRESCAVDIDARRERKAEPGEFRMFMDDYKNMEEKEIKEFIGLVTGTDADSIRGLADRRECIDKLRDRCPVSNRRLAQILRISRNCFNYLPPAENRADKLSETENNMENNTENNSEKKLDVWLL